MVRKATTNNIANNRYRLMSEIKLFIHDRYLLIGCFGGESVQHGCWRLDSVPRQPKCGDSSASLGMTPLEGWASASESWRRLLVDIFYSFCK